MIGFDFDPIFRIAGISRHATYHKWHTYRSFVSSVPLVTEVVIVEWRLYQLRGLRDSSSCI